MSAPGTVSRNASSARHPRKTGCRRISQDWVSLDTRSKTSERAGRGAGTQGRSGPLVPLNGILSFSQARLKKSCDGVKPLARNLAGAL